MSRQLENTRPIVAIDFDKTLSVMDFQTFNDNPDFRLLAEEAHYVLQKLNEMGCILILWTCRHDEYLEMAKEFLKEEDIYQYFHEFNDNYMPELNARGVVANPRKIIADYYIDDLNYDQSKEINFLHLLELVKQDAYFGSIV